MSNKKYNEFYKFLLTICLLITANISWAFVDIFPEDTLNDQNWFFGEEFRFVGDGQLHMKTTAHGNSNNTGFSTFGISMLNQATFSHVSADITINEATSDNNAKARSRVGSYIFNDGTGSGNDEGNIFADVGIYHDGTNLKGYSRIILCKGDDFCSNDWDVVHFDDTSFGNPLVNTAHSVSMSWDPTMKKIDFSFNGAMVSYTFPMGTSINPLDYEFTGLTSTNLNDFPSPGSGLGDGQNALIDASYDNVVYNGAAYDDFTNPIIDINKWDTSMLNYLIDSDEGVLNMALESQGGNNSNSLTLKYPNEDDYLQSTVTVTEAILNDTNTNDARARARVTGYWYDDGTPGDGDTGEVFAEIRLISRADLSDDLVVELVVFKCGDSPCNNGDDLFFDQPADWAAQAQLNKAHVISIKREGAVFTFGFDGQYITHDASSQTPTVQPSETMWKAVGLRADRLNDGTESASITAKFDNVLTTPPRFGDVPDTHPFLPFVELLAEAGVTGGCKLTPLEYCPNGPVTRAQMAVFLEKAINGSTFMPPPAMGIFSDVDVMSGFAPWIEQLFADGITAGCKSTPLEYCPNTSVTRAQMAVFLLKGVNGTAFMPPAATGVFTDVVITSGFAPWIEQLFADGITGGCGVNLYCPNNPVTRGQMAVFLVKAFNL